MPTLSDDDILLMSVCISNGHKPMEGQAECFCSYKRIEKGISKG